MNAYIGNTARRSRLKIRAVTAVDATKSVLCLAASGPVVVFAGAFISCRTPSSLPMAAPLKQAIALSMWATGRPLLVTALGTEPLKILSGSRFWDVPLELLAEEVIRAGIAANLKKTHAF